MLNSLNIIQTIKTKKDIDLNKDKWLFYLYFTKEHNYNLNHLKTLSELTNKNVLNYVVRNLEILNEEKEQLTEQLLFYVEETIKWMEVAKCGTKSNRKDWVKKGYDLYSHNIGSFQIYKEQITSYDEIVATLIRTHGLVGQYIKKEVNLNKNKDLHLLIEKKLISKDDLTKVLIILNKCIIKAVSSKLWDNVESDVIKTIDKIVNNDFKDEKYYDIEYIVERLVKLRNHATIEQKKSLEKMLKENPILIKAIGMIFEKLELWFFDSALANFSFDEIVKILYIISTKIDNHKAYEHLSFEKIMKNIYLDYSGNKVINIYKQRIIEKYLNDISINDITEDRIKNNHIKPLIEYCQFTILFSFEFSIQAIKLIEFCEVAYESDNIFNKAVFILYDLFNFRRDQYDRFYNEIEYLKIMNDSLSKKAKILDYINGRSILDVGPGGGALMDLINERFVDADVYGIDISSNVIEELTKKKANENKKWNIIKGDALELSKYIEKNKIDTVIYSSIIHELFSYIPLDGKKFNYDTINKALQSAYDILPIGGRIIIRDGIMMEDSNLKRIIKFKNKDDINILDRYCHDFEGRKIIYDKIKEDEVVMNINDAMEFLYTYTWGENSYSLEVKEQFGYFTPNGYIDFIKKIFKDKCKIIECLHFLQDGYQEHLLNYIEFFDDKYNVVSLPDSTCIIVIEKIK
jgi:phospholipid N-methyltransferase